MIGGFSAQTYGTSLVLLPLYEGECDCSKVFAHSTNTGESGLIGSIEDEVSEVFFWFENAFHPDFLPPSAAVQNGTSAGMASALLRPWDGKVMVLDVGPNVCAYK